MKAGKREEREEGYPQMTQMIADKEIHVHPSAFILIFLVSLW